MHSTLVRVQNVFGFFTTVAFFISGLIALSVLLSPQRPTAELSVQNVQVVKGRPHYYSTKKEEYAHIRFDLDADLSSLFNWNTKQVFVYVLATWPSTSHPDSLPPSSAIIWDNIIPSAPSPSRNYLADLISSYTNTKKTPSQKKKTTTKQPKASSKKGSAAPGVIHLANQRAKYQITDVSGKIANVGNATLELGWNVQPWVGALLWTGSGTAETHPSAGWVESIAQASLRAASRWEGLKGGKVEGWAFPDLKGAKTSSSSSAASADDTT
ncbi:MAG: hypothetical protein M4579_001519 [Chaenotheca gracillima]|nr:MAG: hypothetical protein M4579_001519 [Chaenotheca gracillima]